MLREAVIVTALALAAPAHAAEDCQSSPQGVRDPSHGRCQAPAVGNSDQPLLLTGEIRASQAHRVLAPAASSWQIQVQWMMPEGQRAEVGEEIVHFDAADLSTKIENLENDLARIDGEYRKDMARLESERLQADFDAFAAEIALEKAELDAAVPADTRAKLEYAQLQVELEKARSDLIEKRMAARDKEQEIEERQRRHELERGRKQRELDTARSQMGERIIDATQSGPILYAVHPWRGQQILPGDSVQRGMEVASVPDTGSFYVRAWLDELDRDQVAEGDAVDLMLDAYPGRVFTGRIAQISNASNERSGLGESAYFEVAIEIIEEPEAELLPGMSVLAAVGGLPDAAVPPAGSRDRKAEPLTVPGEVASATPKYMSPPNVGNNWNFTISFLATDGKPVEAGQPVVGFDDKKMKEELQVKQAELAQKEQELAKLINDHETQEEDQELRIAELEMNLDKAQRKADYPPGTVASLEMEKLKLDLARAERELTMGRAQLDAKRELAQAEREVLKSEIDRLAGEVAELERGISALRLTADRPGLVLIESNHNGERYDVGDTVWRGTRVAQLPDMDELVLKLKVPERDAQRVAIGQRARITLDAHPDKTFTGRVTALGQVFARRSRENPEIAFDVTVTVDEPDTEIMRPTMTARVTLMPDSNAARKAP